jgi:uncharacterized membrane protein
MTSQADRRLRIFVIAFRLVTGVSELLSGFALLAIPTRWLRWVIFTSTRGELRVDPDDRIARLLRERVPSLIQHHHGSLALILIGLGVVKVTSAMGLIRRRAWGYDIAVGVLVL